MQIIVLGTHRSGTSLVAQLLHRLGFFTGKPEELLAATDDHRNYFGERKDVVRANSDFLIDNSLEWLRISPLDKDFVFREESVKGLESSVDKVIHQLNVEPHWFIKDPLFCLTIPFWQRFFTEPLYLYVYRHPLEVACSMELNNSFPIKFGCLLWEKYNLLALQHIPLKKTVFVSYHGLLSTPEKEIRKIITAVSQGIAAKTACSMKDLVGIVDRGYDERPVKNYSFLLKESQERLFKQLKAESFEDLHRFESDSLLARYEDVFYQASRFVHLSDLTKSHMITKETLPREKELIIKKLKGENERTKNKLKEVYKTVNDLQVSLANTNSALLTRNNLISKLKKRIDAEEERKRAFYDELTLAKTTLQEKDKIISDYWDRIQTMRITNRFKRLIGIKKN